jgi:3-oxoacyl-ACP reductase-like protein
MSIFGTIKDAIFGSAKAAPAPAPAAAPAEAAAPAPAPAATPETLTEDQIYAVLADKAQALGQDLNYKTSIVDLMKTLGQDSSLEARTTLAGELGYTGDTSDTATMNIWLHQKTMDKMMNG